MISYCSRTVDKDIKILNKRGFLKKISKDNYGFIYCYIHVKLETIKLLLNYIDSSMNDNSVLHKAIQYEDKELIALLFTDMRINSDKSNDWARQYLNK